MSHAPGRLIRLTFLYLVLVALITACRAVEPTPAPNPAEVKATTDAMVNEFVAAYPLAATAWDLDFFGSPEASVPLLPDTRASVTYFWDRYIGFDGCSWLLGVYDANDEGELRMYTPLRTPNVCGPEEFINQSSLFVGALLNVTEYRMEGEQLIADTVDDQRLLTFSPAPLLPMPGTEWELKFWWNTDREDWYPVLPLSQSTITFSPDGQASGSGGCNSYTASYEGDLQVEKVMEATDTYAELPSLTFGPVAAQMAACSEPEGIMAQEQGFFVALGSTAYYFKLGGMLMLLDARGNPLVVLAARSAPTVSQATPTPDPAIYNQVPDTTVFEPGECTAILDAPVPAYTSNSLSGAPSGEIRAGEYEVTVAAAYETSTWFALNTEGPVNYVNSTSVSSLSGECAASNP